MKSWVIEWVIGAAAVIFFVCGRYVMPFYDAVAEIATEEEGGTAGMVLVMSYVLLGILALRLAIRIFKKS